MLAENWLIISLIIILILIYKNKNKNKYTGPISSEVNFPLVIDKSNIEGVGLFTTQKIKKDTDIFVGIKDSNVTRIGSLINHSWNPNTIVSKKNDYLYTIKSINDINPGDELTVNYNVNTPVYIKRADPNWK